ncbi:MAG: hypothetical protein ACFE0I_01105 [Elainellaceae cyanobacterium]
MNDRETISPPSTGMTMSCPSENHSPMSNAQFIVPPILDRKKQRAYLKLHDW